MLFLKNFLTLFFFDFKKNKFFNISFKNKYKLYIFFFKNKKYFSNFFSILKIKNITLFFYLNFFFFFIKKNFFKYNFLTLQNCISHENTFFCITYFLNKLLKVKYFKSNIYLKNKNYYGKINGASVVNIFSYLKSKDTFVNFFKKNIYNVCYSGTSLGKYLKENCVKNLSVYFLRKTKMFNKGRYSRNRQNYRTGVYWCLYINIMVLFGLYFYFYGFVFNFGYLWWLLFSLFLSFFFPRMVKYRLYDPKTFLKILYESQPLLFYIIKKKN